MIYFNQNKKSAIASIEFAPTVGGDYSFIHVRTGATPEELSAVKAQIAGLGGTILAESTLDKSPIFVIRGPKTDFEILDALSAKGDVLKLPKTEHKLTPWKLRGAASMVGQTGQILSAALNAKGLDSATMTFASLNMIANITNIIFGGETKTDDHRLVHLKREFNQKLREYIPADRLPPSPLDQRAKLRNDNSPAPDLATGFYNFIKRNSVSVCEIGLRFIGSAALVIPFANAKVGVRAFSEEIKKHHDTVKKDVASLAKQAESAEGEAKKALLKASRKANTLGLTKAMSVALKDMVNKDRFTLGAGLLYVVGKSVGLASKVPDPYDPKPHSWVDTLREKVTFRLSSAIESLAALTIVYDRLLRKERVKVEGKPLSEFFGEFKLDAHGNKIQARTTEYKKMGNFFEGITRNFVKETPQWISKLKTLKSRDWFGGIGGILFASGFAIRYFAPFGSKEVDMKELNAHIEDGLAKVPDDKLPQALAEFAAKLTEEFKGTVEYGQVFRALEEGLHTYHGISLKYDSPEQTRIAMEEPPEKSFSAQYAKKPSVVTSTPSRSKAEQISQSANLAVAAR